MQKAIEILTNPTVRRLVVFLLGFLTVLLHKKLGLDLDPNDLVAMAVTVIGYIGQSAYTDASKARSDALLGAAEAHADAAESNARAAAPTPPMSPSQP